MRIDECPVRATANVIGGKWKPLILHSLKTGARHYGELQGTIPDRPQKSPHGPVAGTGAERNCSAERAPAEGSAGVVFADLLWKNAGTHPQADGSLG